MKSKALFISFQPVVPCDGVSKKVFAQRDGIADNGYDCDIVYPKWNSNGSQTFYINEKILIENITRTFVTFPKVFYDALATAVLDNGYEVIYIRYCLNACRHFNKFLKICTSKKLKIYLEIPTYPYDGEFFYWRKAYQYFKEKYYRNQWRYYLKHIVTFSESEVIYGIPAIKVSNAVAFIPPIKKPRPTGAETINLLIVANIAFWHGIDRIIEGLHIFNSKKETRLSVKLTIVGGGDEMLIGKLKKMVSLYHLDNSIQFMGPMEGSSLNELFDESDVAIGCLGCHRKNITKIRALKSVEYAMRGIPFIYSEDNPDFDNCNYIYKVPADETPINIDDIIQFYLNVKMSPEEINKTAQNFTWAEQMKKVFNS